MNNVGVSLYNIGGSGSKSNVGVSLYNIGGSGSMSNVGVSLITIDGVSVSNVAASSCKLAEVP